MDSAGELASLPCEKSLTSSTQSISGEQCTSSQDKLIASISPISLSNNNKNWNLKEQIKETILKSFAPVESSSPSEPLYKLSNKYKSCVTNKRKSIKKVNTSSLPCEQSSTLSTQSISNEQCTPSINRLITSISPPSLSDNNINRSFKGEMIETIPKSFSTIESFTPSKLLSIKTKISSNLKSSVSNKRKSIKKINTNRVQIKRNQKTNDNQLTADGQSRKYFFFFPMKGSRVRQGKGGNKPFTCKVCDKSYTIKFSLKRHFLQSHINKKYLSNNDLWNCNIVPKNKDNTVSNNEKVQSHGIFLKNNDGGQMPGLYKCSLHNILCDHEYQLINHYAKVPHSNKELNCKNCKETFETKTKLNEHVPNCQLSGASTSNYCKKCKVNFENATLFEYHLKVHNDKKICRYCHSPFSSCGNRVRHEKKHKGCAGFKCEHCDYFCWALNDLQNHNRKQHIDKYFLCSKCPKYGKPKLFETNDALQTHILKNHFNVVKDDSKQMIVKSRSSSYPEVKNVPLEAASSTVPNQSSSFKTSRDSQSSSTFMFSKREFSNEEAVPQHQATMHKGRLSYKRKAKKTKEEKSDAVEKQRTIKEKQEEEARFYMNVSYSIAENLLHHVDGKENQLSLIVSSETLSVPDPETFLLDFSCNPYGQSLLNNSTVRFSNHCNSPAILNATGLNKTEDASNFIKKDVNSSEYCFKDSFIKCSCRFCSENRSIPMNLKEQRKLSNRSAESAVYWCKLCHNQCESNADFYVHCSNNHSNTDPQSNLVITEGYEKYPINFFNDLYPNINPSQNGILQNNSEIASNPQDIDNCTKCKRSLRSLTIDDVYDHVSKCGGEEAMVQKHIRTKIECKKIKNTLQYRMDLSAKRTPYHQNSKPQRNRKTYFHNYKRKYKGRFSSVKETTPPCSTCNKRFSSQAGLKNHQCTNKNIKKDKKSIEAYQPSYHTASDSSESLLENYSIDQISHKNSPYQTVGRSNSVFEKQVTTAPVGSGVLNPIDSSPCSSTHVSNSENNNNEIVIDLSTKNSAGSVLNIDPIRCVTDQNPVEKSHLDALKETVNRLTCSEKKNADHHLSTFKDIREPKKIVNQKSDVEKCNSSDLEKIAHLNKRKFSGNSDSSGKKFKKSLDEALKKITKSNSQLLEGELHEKKASLPLFKPASVYNEDNHDVLKSNKEVGTHFQFTLFDGSKEKDCLTVNKNINLDKKTSKFNQSNSAEKYVIQPQVNHLVVPRLEEQNQVQPQIDDVNQYLSKRSRKIQTPSKIVQNNLDSGPLKPEEPTLKEAINNRIKGISAKQMLLKNKLNVSSTKSCCDKIQNNSSNVSFQQKTAVHTTNNSKTDSLKSFKDLPLLEVAEKLPDNKMLKNTTDKKLNEVKLPLVKTIGKSLINIDKLESNDLDKQERTKISVSDSSEIYIGNKSSEKESKNTNTEQSKRKKDLKLLSKSENHKLYMKHKQLESLMKGNSRKELSGSSQNENPHGISFSENPPFANSKIIQVTEDKLESSPTFQASISFLSNESLNSEVASSHDRDSPPLEVLVSSVTQNLEKFDEQSCSDDDKFSVSEPICTGSLPNKDIAISKPVPTKSLNFTVIMPHNEKLSFSNMCIAQKSVPIDVISSSQNQPINATCPNLSIENTRVADNSKSLKSTYKEDTGTESNKVENDKNSVDLFENSIPVLLNAFKEGIKSCNSLDISNVSSDSSAPKFNNQESSSDTQIGTAEKQSNYNKKENNLFLENASHMNRQSFENHTTPIEETVIQNSSVQIIENNNSAALLSDQRKVADDAPNCSLNISKKATYAKRKSNILVTDKDPSKTLSNKYSKISNPTKSQSHIKKCQKSAKETVFCEKNRLISTDETEISLDNPRLHNLNPPEMSVKNPSTAVSHLRAYRKDNFDSCHDSNKSGPIKKDEVLDENMSSHLGTEHNPARVSVSKDSCLKDSEKIVNEFHSNVKPEIDIDNSSKSNGTEAVIKKGINDVKQLLCPHCRVPFSYLNNFHRHVEACKQQFDSGNNKNQTSFKKRLPKKVEESVLKLYRDQFRQNQMILESEASSANPKKIASSCSFCHKIFFSKFLGMKHLFDHKIRRHHQTCEVNEKNLEEALNPSQSLAIVNQDIASQILEQNVEATKDNHLNLNGVTSAEKISVNSVVPQLPIIKEESSNATYKNILTHDSEPSSLNVTDLTEFHNANPPYVTEPTAKTSDIKTITSDSTSNSLNSSGNETKSPIKNKLQLQLNELPPFRQGRGRKKSKPLNENGGIILSTENKHTDRSLKKYSESDSNQKINVSKLKDSIYNKMRLVKTKSLGAATPSLNKDVNKCLEKDFKSYQLCSSSQSDTKSSLLIKTEVEYDAEQALTTSPSQENKTSLKKHSPLNRSRARKSVAASILIPEAKPGKGRKRKQTTDNETIEDPILKSLSPPEKSSRRIRSVKKEPTLEESATVKNSLPSKTPVKTKFRRDGRLKNSKNVILPKTSGISPITSLPSTSSGSDRRLRNTKASIYEPSIAACFSDCDEPTPSPPIAKCATPKKKVCAICGKKFLTRLERNRHVELVHKRKNSEYEELLTVLALSSEKLVKNKSEPTPKRTLSVRRCTKPLPPMKRKYEKQPNKRAS